MREISSQLITSTVADLCIQANKILPEDIKFCLGKALDQEKSPLGKNVLSDLIRNYSEAEKLGIPVCQDTGMTVVFLKIGQEVHICGEGLTKAINKGVAQGYTHGLLRCSVVSDPIERKNTNDNTPAVIHTEIVPGDKIEITVAPKGAGSENMSSLIMLTPAAGEEEIIEFVTDCVKKAGANPCPPIVVGVGIGGNFEGSAILAKKALIRSANQRNANPYYASLEDKILSSINNIGIGPQGFGGDITALGVNIEYGPTHIASLPIAVNIGCHVTRHATGII